MIIKTKINSNVSLINIYFVYYLFLEFFISSGKWDKFSPLYFALVLPILLFITLSLKTLLKIQFRDINIYLILLLVIVLLVTLVRLDIPTIYNLAIFLLPIIIIIESKAWINLKLINTTFILAIVIGAVMYHFGMKRFGYIPYIHAVNSALEPAWKISIFPRTPASGYYALFVLILNYYFNKTKSRYLFYFLSFYFMLFSGLRSTLLLFSVFMCFEVITKFIRFRLRYTYLFLGLFLIIGTFTLINGNKIIELVVESDNKFVKSLIAKSTFTNVSDVEEKENYRSWLWGVHYGIFTNNIFVGVGTYDITDYEPKDLYGKTNFEGSESFFTRWLARIGIPLFLFLFFLFKMYKNSMITKYKYGYILSVLLILILFTYGSFMMPYNFMYFLTFGTINTKYY